MDSTARVAGFDEEVERRAIEAVDQGNLDVRAALWLYLSDSQKWRLVIATRHGVAHIRSLACKAR